MKVETIELKYGMVLEFANGTKALYCEDPGIDHKCVNLLNGEEYDLCNLCRQSDMVKIYKDYTLKEIVWEKKVSILDAKEKEYLSNVVKPFKNRVNFIRKLPCDINENYEYIKIILVSLYRNYKTSETFNLPIFIKGTMYKKMTTNRLYTLKELELD